MIMVSPGNTNSILYVSRYNQITSYEILDHDSRIVDSGITNIIGYNGRIFHTGLTYNFVNNNVYTYKSYCTISGSTYLCTQQFLQSYYDESRLDYFKAPVKSKNTFKTKK